MKQYKSVRLLLKRSLPSLLLALAAGLSLLLPFGSSARAEESTSSGDLRFGGDGTFTVLLLSDLQDFQFTTDLVVRGETSVLKDYPADLIVLLGDQLAGENPVLHWGDGTANCKKTLETLLAPVAESGIPFAVVFGNHDYDAPLSIAEQVAIYESYPTCVGVCYGKDADASGAFALPVYMADGSAKAMELYFFDSGSYLPNGDYGTVSAEQVAWYNGVSAELHTENDNQALPSVAFFHIPLPEVYDLFTEVEKGTEGALEGVGSGAGKYYLPNYDLIFTGDVNEAPCPSSENNGLFNAFLENSDVFLAVNGHDHVNSYIGSLHGIDLASAPGSTYTNYGSADVRGVRLFRFTEHNVRNYETIHVRYTDYDTPASYGYLRYYFETTTAIPNAAKPVLLALILIIAVIVVLLCVTRKRRRARRAERRASREAAKIAKTKG